jgi:Zn-dependent protease with chaperone function
MHDPLNLRARIATLAGCAAKAARHAPRAPLQLMALVLAATVLAACSTNALTGRSQLLLVSDAQVAQNSESYYNALVGDLQKKKQIVEHQPVNLRVNRVTNRLIEQAVQYEPRAAQWDWQVSVIDDSKTVNAFCMPNGLIGVYTGLFAQLQLTDDELAEVLGHEIGHALAGHGAEKMSVQMAGNLAVLGLSVALSSNDQDFAVTNTALTLGALAFINLPNSRATEVEADQIGIELAARAGFNPAAAVSLWQKMEQANGSSGKVDFFSTHPAPQRRQENLQDLVEPLTPMYQAALASTQTPFDWLGGDKSARPPVDGNQHRALVTRSH